MKYLKNIQSLVGSTLSMISWTGIKITPVWGSYSAFFTASQIAYPLAGLYAPRKLLFALWAIKSTLRAYFFSGSLLLATTYYLPTTAAALFLSAPNTRKTRLLTALAFVSAALLFFGAVGYSAALWYATLWVIPTLLASVGVQNLFARSIVATFLAHALGSAFWAYTLPLAPVSWVALIPVALTERLFYASGITLSALCINRVLFSNSHQTVRSAAPCKQ